MPTGSFIIRIVHDALHWRDSIAGRLRKREVGSGGVQNNHSGFLKANLTRLVGTVLLTVKEVAALFWSSDRGLRLQPPPDLVAWLQPAVPEHEWLLGFVRFPRGAKRESLPSHSWKTPSLAVSEA